MDPISLPALSLGEGNSSGRSELAADLQMLQDAVNALVAGNNGGSLPVPTLADARKMVTVSEAGSYALAAPVPVSLTTFGVNGQGYVTVYRATIQQHTLFQPRPGLSVYISDGPSTTAAEWRAADTVGESGIGQFLWTGPTGTYDVQLVDTTLGTAMADDSPPPDGYEAPTLTTGINFGPPQPFLANDAAGTTLGTVVGKVQVFGTDGSVKGFIPIYDAIT